MLMHRHTIFIFFLVAFVFGIGSAIFVPNLQWIVILGGAVCGCVAVILYPSIKNIGLLLCVVAGSIFGLWRGDTAWRWAHEQNIYTGKQIVFNGVVMADPIESTFHQRMIVDIRECSIDEVREENCPVERVLLSTGLYQGEISMRTGISTECELKNIENFSQDFDYVMYNAAKGVLYKCENESVQRWKSNDKIDKLYVVLARIRHYFEKKLEYAVIQPQAALAAGLLFGGDKRLSQDWQEKFSITGLTHIVAVSGYNVTVIAHGLIFMGIFIGLWRRQSVWLAIVGVVFFVMMIGAPAPAIRAGIMGVTVLLLMYGGRINAALPALFFAGSIMLAVNPLLIRYDIGFQLSFLASLGIIIFYPVVEKMVSRGEGALGVKEIILVTVSAQIFVVPVIAYHFHTVALLSLFANILVLPVIPLAMMLISSVLILGMLSQVILLWGGWSITILLKWVFGVVDVFAKVPYAQMSIDDISVGAIALWYLCVFGIISYIQRRTSMRCRHHRDK